MYYTNVEKAKRNRLVGSKPKGFESARWRTVLRKTFVILQAIAMRQLFDICFSADVYYNVGN